MIRIEATQTKAELDRIHDEMMDRANTLFQRHLIKVFDRAIEIQRAKMRPDGGYNDDTGNLRSSTGYIMRRDGSEVYRNFKLSTYGTEKEKGLKEGQRLAEEVMSQLTTAEGFSVVFVSGMEYASWVENKGYSVLSTATYRIDESIEQAFKEIGAVT